MAFDPSRLYSLLLNTGLAIKDNALYQVIYQLISAVSKLTATVIPGSPGSGSGSLPNQSYITVNNDIAILPFSRQLVAGTNITLDTTIPGQIIINSSGSSGSGYWTPLTDGDVDETDLIFADANAVMVFVPV